MIANACCLDFSWLLSLKLQTLLFVTSWESTRCSSVDFQGSFHAKINRETVNTSREHVEAGAEREWTTRKESGGIKTRGKVWGRGDLITIAAFVTPSRTTCTFVFPVSPHFISLNRGAQPPRHRGPLYVLLPSLFLYRRAKITTFSREMVRIRSDTVRERRTQPKKGARSSVGRGGF